MLMALGPVLFDIRLDLQQLEEVWNTGYAKHDVMGAAPVYEFVGEEEGTFSLSGEIFPYVFGGLDGLAALEAARLSRISLPFLRGDGRAMGFVVIKSITRADTMLDAREGVGNSISYSISLLKASSPGLGGAESLLRLFL